MYSCTFCKNLQYYLFFPQKQMTLLHWMFLLHEAVSAQTSPISGLAMPTPDHALHTPIQFSPVSSVRNLEYRYLVAGDFNIHNAATDPSRLLSAKEESESTPYFDRATDLGFTLLNTPGVYTRFPFTRTHRLSAIDLAFANGHMFPAFRSWDASSLPSRGSDHAPILISLRPPSPHNDRPRPRWQDADWPGLTDRFENWLVPPPPNTPSPNQLDH